jgi:hypothetical protein
LAVGVSGAARSPAAPMVGGSRWQGCSGMRGKEAGGGFICPVARRGSFASPSWPTGAPAWARGGGDVRRSRRPMENGGSPADECAEAAWHRPKLPARVIGPRCTVASAPASDRWVLRCLGVRTRPGYSTTNVAGAWCDVARGFAQFKNSST